MTKRAYRRGPTWRCGCPRTPENTLSTVHPQCRTCKLARQRERYEKSPLFRCGHPRSDANTVNGGSGFGQCRECRNTMRREVRAGRRPRRAASNGRQAIQPTGSRYAQLMAEAKAAYQALLEREREASKGGRPKKPGGGRNIHIPKSTRRPQMPQVQRDPIPDLTTQLSEFYGLRRGVA